MNQIKTICVYCGSSSDIAESFKQAARDLGHGIARRKMNLVYGGGRLGLMGITADSALAGGTTVTGIIPEHLQTREIRHDGLSETIVVDSMHTRKRLMAERSDAFVVMPGGLGTLDEAFEILTWKQLSLHDKPVVIANIDGYWDLFLNLVDHMIEIGFVKPVHRQTFTVANSVDEIFGLLENSWPPAIPTDLSNV
jgi:uncharacterized protein (TIGR00730 family)